MNKRKRNNETTKRLALVGLLTALSAVLAYIKIPIISSVTITLVLPIVVVGAIICGPWVGAWLTVIPAITSFGEAALFMTYNPGGTIFTLILKGVLSGLAAGFVYKLISSANFKGGVICAAAVAPIVNTGTFLLGCYVFIWPELVDLAMENGVGIGLLLFGLAGMNFIVELILNIILCPAIIRIIELAKRKGIGKISTTD
jgi:uncharacterized membrane protein